MKKRILTFSTAYFPLIGGAEVAIKEITDRIPEMEFVMITARLKKDFPAQEKLGNIQVHRIGNGDHWDKYRLICQWSRYAQNLGDFDAIWGIMASYAGFAALRYKKRENRPFLLTLQEGDSRWQIYKHVWWCWPYFKQIFKKADKIQAISNCLAKWARDLGAKCPIDVIPNGVDLEKFQASVIPAPYQVRGKHPAGIQKQIITVSRLVKKNGIGDLIKAMKFLDHSINLLIAGDGELKNKLIKLTEKLNLKDRVHFLGNVSHTDLPKYLWASDVFCRPSLSEGLGNVFLEAMASELPIVGTKVGGILDFLIDNQTGLFCKVGNPKDIAEKINRILSDNNLREKLILNGKKLVKEKYNWDLIADKMKNIFLSFLPASPKPQRGERKQESNH